MGHLKCRVANAKKDPTYLLDDVEIVATFKLFWREADVSPVNQGYHYHDHYNHNAETYYEVGDALGRAMAAMLKETK